MRAALIFTLLTISSVARAKPTTIEVPEEYGYLTLSFDDKRISEAELLEAAKLSPYFTQRMENVDLTGLDTCHDAQNEAIACPDPAKHVPPDPVYFRDGELSIKHNAGVVKAVAARRVPRELAPALKWLVRRVAYDAGIEERKLAFYRAWKPVELARAIGGIDTSKECAPIVTKIVAAPSPAAKREIVETEWAACVFGFGKDAMGPFPEAPWKAFLQAKGVHETWTYEHE